MLQFNLLPDIKQEHIKSQRLKQTVVTLSILVAIGALTVLVLLFLVVNVLQKKHLSDLNNDIKTDTTTLKQTPDLDKILTVQNQLNSLTSMHDQKPVVTRLFGYLTQIVPSKVNINNIAIDFTQSSINLSGSADSVGTINQFVDTLKFTTYSDSNGDNGTNAFSNVVLNDFNKTDKGASYTIALSFDPSIFNSTKDTKLTVPAQITTRSNLDAPLFTNPPKSSQ